jgi:hypothetical protein
MKRLAIGFLLLLAACKSTAKVDPEPAASAPVETGAGPSSANANAKSTSAPAAWAEPIPLIATAKGEVSGARDESAAKARMKKLEDDLVKEPSLTVAMLEKELERRRTQDVDHCRQPDGMYVYPLPQGLVWRVEISPTIERAIARKRAKP